MKILWKYFKGYKKGLVLGPLFKLTEAIMELFVPVIMAKIIDIGIADKDLAYIFKMGGLMLLFGAAGLCVALICQYYAAHVAYGFGRNLRQDMFRHIMTFSGEEVDRFGISTLITRLTSDANQVQTAVNMFIRLAVRAPFLTVGSIIMAFSINAKIAAIFLAAMVIIVIILYLVMSKSVPFYTELQAKQDNISRITEESLSGVRVIRAFSQQDKQIQKFEQADSQWAKTCLSVNKLSALLNPMTYAVANLAIIAIVWFGAKLAFNGALLSGEIIALVSYMTQALLVLIVFANLVVIFTKAFASAKRIAAVLKANTSIKQGNISENNPCNEKEAISFKNVSFAYKDGGENALTNINIDIKRGETIGVIGGTGCGKTTFANLITRFYDVSSGAVEIDGLNVKSYTFEALRKKISLVPQRAVLFTGTVRQNIQFGKGNATDEEIWHALQIAQGADFVSKMENKLDTMITQGGKNLSGGQRQRLTIARAVAAKPNILILDDSASALDYATDAALRKSLKEIESSTIIIISQRAASIKNADKILVLDDGEQIAFDTHKNLLKTCEIYREICMSQNLSEAD